MNTEPATSQRRDRHAMPVFVIGMRRFPERHERTLQQLGDAGIDAQLFPGVDLVDGDTLAPDEKVSHYSRLFSGSRPPFTLGQLGCYFAHYRLLKHILTLGVRRALVLECDADAKPAAKELIEEVAGLDEKYELVYFSCGFHPGGGAGEIDGRTLPHAHVLHRGVGPVYCTAAYAVTRGAIEKLLPQMIPMRKLVDSLLGKPYCTGLKTYVVQPNAFDAPPGVVNSLIGKTNIRYEPPGAVRRIVFRLFCALLAKPLQLFLRLIKPFRPVYWRRRLHQRRLKPGRAG